jgi:bifunctional DNase/RNase
LALRSGSPIFADDDLLDEVGRIVPEDEPSGPESDDQGIPEVDQTAIIDEFRDFIDSIKPEDFTD